MPITPYRGFDVTIDGSSLKSYGQINAYELAVLTDLNHIYNSQTGRVLFNDFRGTGRSIKIVPEEKNGTNANARGVSAKDSLPLGEKYPDGCSWLESLSGKRGCSSPTIGSGRGSNAVIEFSPLKYNDKYPGFRPDEILIHEMVHAIRDARGINGGNKELLAGSIFRGGKIYDNEDEFIAILITNIYSSEQKRPSLRMDHNGFGDLDTDTDETFLPHRDESDYRYRLLHKLVAQDTVLALELQKIPSKFNPIRRFFYLQSQPRYVPLAV